MIQRAVFKKGIMTPESKEVIGEEENSTVVS
jgi:hypothetical protein